MTAVPPSYHVNTWLFLHVNTHLHRFGQAVDVDAELIPERDGRGEGNKM